MCMSMYVQVCMYECMCVDVCCHSDWASNGRFHEGMTFLYSAEESEGKSCRLY